MPGRHSSQGTTVTFSGTSIGYLTDFDDEAKAAGLVERTTASSTIVGSGGSSRVVRQYDCTEIEPGTLTIQFWGSPSFSRNDIGAKGTLTLSGPWGSRSGSAILTDWNHSGKASQWTRGSATFTFSGG